MQGTLVKQRNDYQWMRLGFVSALLWFAACSNIPFVPLATYGPTFQPEGSIPPEQVSWRPADSAACPGACWRGLVIGKATEPDVMAVLQSLTFIDQKTVSRNDPRHLGPQVRLPGEPSPDVDLRADCVTPHGLPQDWWPPEDSPPCLHAGLADGILTGLDIGPNTPSTFGQAIDVLGNPDYAGWWMEGVESNLCWIYLLWRRRQLQLTSFSETTATSEVEDCYRFHDDQQFKSSLITTSVSYKSQADMQYLFSKRRDYYHTFTESMLLP